MGDTVVKAVKDLTIWLGEVTVLPSNDASVFERLKYGFFKSTLGMLEVQQKGKDVETGSSDENENDYQELKSWVNVELAS